MEKPEQSARVKAVREYLQEIGHPITSTQGYEVLARSMGLKNKHVLSASSQPGQEPAPAPVLPLGWTPSRAVVSRKTPSARMDFVIPINISTLEAGLEALNDEASRFLTGTDYALSDIGYEHVPQVVYGKGYVAYRVTGLVESDGTDGDDEDTIFYENLLVLVNALEHGSAFELDVDGTDYLPAIITKMSQDALRLLTRYASTQGENNKEVNENRKQVVFSYKLRRSDKEQDVELGALKYSLRVGPRTWNFSSVEHNWLLRLYP